MCAAPRSDDNGFGPRIFAGRYGDAFLQRVDWTPGYSVFVWHGRHVAEPTELSDEESSGYWAELMRVTKAIETKFQPAKINLQMLGNGVPHLHTHIVPRYIGDPAPMAPLPFPESDAGKLPEEDVQRDAATLRSLIG